MTDRELLKLAAKAAGFDGHLNPAGVGFLVPCGMTPFGVGYTEWNPLSDDGDAFRLAVKLDIDLTKTNDLKGDEAHYCAVTVSTQDGFEDVEYELNDPYAATRRCIVRAAAEIGKTK